MRTSTTLLITTLATLALTAVFAAINVGWAAVALAILAGVQVVGLRAAERAAR